MKANLSSAIAMTTSNHETWQQGTDRPGRERERESVREGARVKDSVNIECDLSEIYLNS